MLIDNTLFLREKYPNIRHYFRENEENLKLDRVTVLDSKQGAKTIRYQLEENELMVHSLYDPMREAERIIKTHKDKITAETHVFFYGIGMGYHIEEFHEEFPDNTYSVYEPVPEIFAAMTDHQLLENIITKQMRNIYIDTHEAEVNAYLQEFQTSNRNIQIIILSSYENIVKEKLTRFHEKIKNTVGTRRSSLHTDLAFQKRWVMNSIINFKETLETPNMLLDIDREQFAGKPAIIVAAGPSLAEDMEHLRYIKENNLAYLFSVGSAINSLIEYDVMPDAVFTYDPGPKNHRVFEKMIEKGIEDIPMVFGSSVGHETLTNYKGPKVHFITSQDRTSLYFLREQLNQKKDLISDSPSIAVMTFQVLNKLGSSPIVFAGQNLGYLHDRRYSEGIEYDFVKSEVSKQEMEKAETVKDVYGNDIKTNNGFNRMREGIESYAKVYAGNYINTTKGGAAIAGVPFQPIDDVIKESLKEAIEKSTWWETFGHYDKAKFSQQESTLKESIQNYKDIVKKFETLLNAMATAARLRNTATMEKLFHQFDQLYADLRKNDYYANFLSFYIRVFREKMQNELKQAVKENNVIVRGEKIFVLFSNFILQCVQASRELERVFEMGFGEKGKVK